MARSKLPPTEYDVKIGRTTYIPVPSRVSEETYGPTRDYCTGCVAKNVKSDVACLALPACDYVIYVRKTKRTLAEMVAGRMAGVELPKTTDGEDHDDQIAGPDSPR